MTTNALTLQLLAWVAARPRTYRETMEVWRTTCLRLTIWEDAIADGLVSVESAKSMRDAGVVVTERGRALLHATAGAGLVARPATTRPMCASPSHCRPRRDRLHGRHGKRSYAGPQPVREADVAASVRRRAPRKRAGLGCPSASEKAWSRRGQGRRVWGSRKRVGACFGD